jgi:DNA-binding transcriptional regulator LsrR (DeoR family)
MNKECRMDQHQHQATVFVANGEIHAQQIRAFLEAAGISSALRGESLRNTHGLTLDGLGMVKIVVAAADEDRARALLASAEAGEFRLDDEGQTSS